MSCMNGCVQLSYPSDHCQWLLLLHQCPWFDIPWTPIEFGTCQKIPWFRASMWEQLTAITNHYERYIDHSKLNNANDTNAHSREACRLSIQPRHGWNTPSLPTAAVWWRAIWRGTRSQMWLPTSSNCSRPLYWLVKVGRSKSNRYYCIRVSANPKEHLIIVVFWVRIKLRDQRVLSNFIYCLDSIFRFSERCTAPYT